MVTIFAILLLLLSLISGQVVEVAVLSMLAAVDGSDEEGAEERMGYMRKERSLLVGIARNARTFYSSLHCHALLA